MISFLILLVSSVQGQLDCQTCMVAAQTLQYLLSNSQVQSSFKSYVAEFCSYSSTPTDCNSIGAVGIQEVTDVLQRRIVNPTYLCSGLGICSSASYVPEDFDIWAQKILFNTPAHQIPVRTTSYLYFAQISDVRLDLNYFSGKSNTCSSGPCCREGTPTSTSQIAGTYGDYNCDLPLSTFRMALDSILASKPSFIIWNGNSVTHDLTLSITDRLNTIKTATQEILNKFDSFLYPVFPIFGPLDCYPEHQYDFSDEATLLKGLTSLWSIWLGKQAAAQFSTNGTYSVQYKNTNLRIIGLNTMSCDINNFYLFANVTDPSGYIYWLNNELESAEVNGYKVYIIGNIAPGSSSCVNSWSKHYSVLMERYQNTVMGQFFGNQNKDQFRINTGYFSGKPTGIQFTAPSLSPYKNTNPSYRIYQSDNLSKVVLNYVQYRLDLSEIAPSFSEAYDFLSYYRTDDMLPATIFELATEMKGQELLMMKYAANRYTDGPDSLVGCNDQCINDLYCEITNDRQEKVEECQGVGQSFKEFALNTLYGEWTYLVKSS
ncbi:unnamed protein product [Blepharisma stoltei]|uniref:Sphingomyelin phosphodiesterase n=1 Tax=Blepharisma stoltei TaxID=1481888 RepID=A0AAU9IRU1_9CILI|nr:unnamed protein product [Blepharisma stoltei]